ncbi:ABC transporter permease, partial [bacterium]|nr:ABC transporter permease [bacterium]
MLWTILRKEIQENLVSFRYLLVVAVTLLLAALSFLIMRQDYLSRQERYSQLLPTVDLTTIVMLPPAPLSVLAKGMDESICQQHVVSDRWGVFDTGESGRSFNSLFKLFDTPDLLYITKIILSLCAMFISFRLVSEEKEARTLALTLSHSLGRYQLLLGKWLSGLAGLVLPFLFAVLLSALLLHLSSGVRLGVQDWLGLGLFCLSSVLYLSFFFSLGLLVSCLNVRSSSALAVSLFLWVLLAFALPSLAGAGAGTISDLPSAQSRYVQGRLATRKQDYKQMQVTEFNERAKNYPERDKLIEDYRVRLNRQLELGRALSRLSPAAVYTFLATDFAGTGMYERLRLKQSLLNQVGLISESDQSKTGQSVSYSRSTQREVLNSTGLLNLLVLLL